jgi:indole-3-glycerol phosphate synthase
MAGCDAHSLIDIAHELDMEVVLEVCTLEDMDYARSSEADVIAIRNDWANGNKAAFGNGELSAGISNSLFLLSSSKTSRPVISCAQVSTPAHVRQLAAAGAWGIEIDAKTASASNFALIFGSLKKAINGKGPLFEKKHQE